MSTPILVAGPCAAETREQLLTAAEQIARLPLAKDGCVRLVFRAGIWKPRTSPRSFQGVGDIGLEWLQEVRERYGLKTATEAGTAEQARKAAAAGVDMLWIGSRTSANPIAVQEIADNIEGINIVAVKNPMHEDSELWAGNIERVRQRAKEVWAVHRGCRHKPCWQMAYRLTSAMPDIPLLLDPSHMSGDAAKVESLCRKAESLGYNGYMIEVHPNPKEALSDARQQITPAELQEYIRPDKFNSRRDELDWLRCEIDEADDEIWQAISRRMDVSRRIGKYKHTRNMQIVQPDRFNKVLNRRLKWAEENGIASLTVEKIMNALHEESIHRQEI